MNVEQLRQQLMALRAKARAEQQELITAEMALIIREWTRKVNGK